MSQTVAQIGGVYQPDWSSGQVRVLLLDRHEVFYETKDYTNNWNLTSSLKRRTNIYRTPLETLESRSTKIGEAELTEEEKKVLQPELPLRFGRIKNISWNEIKNQEQLENLIDENPTIKTTAIVLVPFGPDGGQKRGVQMNSENPEGFKISEVLWKAMQIQAEICDRTSSGIGIYRLGYDKGLPSFYVGEYLDLAGILQE